MKLIVSGFARQWLYDVERDSWRSLIEQDRGYTFAATWNTRYYYSAVQNEQSVELVTLDADFKIINRETMQESRNGQPHQIYYNPRDNKIYWCFAQLGIIKIKDAATGAWSTWEPCKEPMESFVARVGIPDQPRRPLVIRRKIIDQKNTKDVNWKHSHYLNSIWFDDADNAFLMSHNRGPSEIVQCSGRELATRTRAGQACHNVWKEGSKIYYCDSGRGNVMELGNESPVLKCDGFPRGVSFDGTTRYIGVSFKGEEKKQRETNDSHIVVADAAWNIERKISMPFPGEIYDIRALCADVCHNRIEPPLER